MPRRKKSQVTARTGTGQPDRTLTLLWRHHAPAERGRGRGPKPALTVDGIVAAATQLADTDGLDRLSMRRVADRLGVTAMSLYTYVPAKAELLDLMTDAAYGELALTPPGRTRWRRRLETIARDNLDLYARHPWLVQVATSRPPLGPHVMAKYEHELHAVERLGLTDVEMDSVLTLVLAFTHVSARGMAEQALARQQTGIDDEQWWSANAPLLARILDPERYPMASRVGTAAGEQHRGAHNPQHAFEFGLQRVLDGVAALIRTR